MDATAPTLRAAAIAALTGGAGAAALVTAGVATPAAGGVTVSPDQGQVLPYVEVQGATEVETARSSETRSTSATLTMVVRGASLTQAEAIAAVVTSVLSSRYAVAGFDVTGATLDLYGPAYRDPPPGARAWSLPIRLRYTLYQLADASE